MRLPTGENGTVVEWGSRWMDLTSVRVEKTKYSSIDVHFLPGATYGVIINLPCCALGYQLTVSSKCASGTRTFEIVARVCIRIIGEWEAYLFAFGHFPTGIAIVCWLVGDIENSNITQLIQIGANPSSHQSAIRLLRSLKHWPQIAVHPINLALINGNAHGVRKISPGEH